MFEGDGAHDVFEQANGREVLGGAPGDEPGPAPAAPEDERQGLEAERGQAREEGERKPGEPRPLGEQDEARGARAEHRSGALAGALAQPFENRGERGPASAGAGVRGGVALEPGVAHEVAGGGPGAVERVPAVRDDADGHPQQRIAAKERGQRPPVVDAAEVQVARAVGEQAHPFGEGGASQRECDAGTLPLKA